MDISPSVLALLAIVAILGHIMGFFWYYAAQHQWRVCQRQIYNLPFRKDQIARELKNSIHAPMHAVIIGAFYLLGCFHDASYSSFFVSLILTGVWAEVWHYVSHRLFHLKQFHWIHVEHHRSHVNSPFTAISFSFAEKTVFDIGLLIPLALFDRFYNLNVLGIGAWYIGYLIINSFSHANFELKSATYNNVFGKILTTTTYHSLHHSRYTGNFGLGTRFLDKLFGTEWVDYEALYLRICGEERPLSNLREKVDVSSSREDCQPAYNPPAQKVDSRRNGNTWGLHRPEPDGD
jgi:Delta7-sterol 5-desaturase